MVLLFFDKHYFTLINNKTNIFFFIYDQNKNSIKNYDSPVEYNKIPKNLIYAFISIEDTEFFKHYGFSIRSILRSFIQNIKKKSLAQGGSTITQQYVKLYNGDLKKTFSRKIKELFISIILELCYTKEEIFQSYCKILYFGKNIIGISECARILFNKEYSNLSLSECAMIAGIVQRPEYYNPIKNKESAIKRRNIVLNRMLKENYINKKEYNEAIKDTNMIFYNNFFNSNKSIYQSVEADMIKLNLPLNHEYIIMTTLDIQIQNIANALFNTKIAELRKACSEIEGSMIITNYKTGKIIAIINGYNLLDKNTNKVFQWKRQIGSIIKPYIMYFALLNGDFTSTLYNDTPLEDTFKWNPKNHNQQFKGQISIEKALINSNNIIPIRILYKYGIHNFISLVQPFFTVKIPTYFSIALGCMEASVFEIAEMFNTFLNKGEKNNLYYIEKIIKKSGGIVYEAKDIPKKNHFNTLYTKPILEILQKIGENSAKKNNIIFNQPIYAKTGTTNGAVSCWFMCANDNYSIVICLGSDNNLQLSKYNILSGNSIAPLGLKILKEIESCHT